MGSPEQFAYKVEINDRNQFIQKLTQDVVNNIGNNINLLRVKESLISNCKLRIQEESCFGTFSFA